MTFEKLKKANELIQTIPIEKRDKKTGKTSVTAYSPVHQRIKAFRSVFPEGMILTELISNEAERDDGVIVIKCTVLTPEGRTLGSGHASEKIGSSFINSTSALENAETSAVGRALGMAGFGIDGGLASAEEMQNALLQQSQPQQPQQTYQPEPGEELPWETASGPVCADCGQVIQPRKTRKGDMWAADSIGNYTERKFGRKLCVDCMKKAEVQE